MTNVDLKISRLSCSAKSILFGVCSTKLQFLERNRPNENCFLCIENELNEADSILCTWFGGF